MPLRGIDHVLVLTDDIDATRDFYVDALGLRPGDRPPLEFPGHWLYARDGPCVHVAERAGYTAHADGLGVGAATGDGMGPVDHIAFAATGYEEVHERLVREGVRAVGNTVPAAGLRQLFLEDPNGVRIEINVGPS